jgi:hypothetical protein
MIPAAQMDALIDALREECSLETVTALANAIADLNTRRKTAVARVKELEAILARCDCGHGDGMGADDHPTGFTAEDSEAVAVAYEFLRSVAS